MIEWQANKIVGERLAQEILKEVFEDIDGGVIEGVTIVIKTRKGEGENSSKEFWTRTTMSGTDTVYAAECLKHDVFKGEI